MPTHDIIDNRHEKLVDHILQILPHSDRAKFAVGYFFLSGLEALGSQLGGLKELRLLIGNTSTRQTIELLSEAYKRLEIVTEKSNELRFARKADQRHMANETAQNLRQTVELMDQTDAGQNLVHDLIRMIEGERLKVRVYTKGRLHAKAYLFDYALPNPGNEGIAVVGSSNLTLAGVESNTELNVLVHDKGNPLRKGEGNHARLTAWFEELWVEAQDFDAALMNELKQSWAATLATPYDIFMKTLFTLVKDRLDGEEQGEILWDDEITTALANFQRQAVRTAIQMIRDHGGCFVSDVVGLGKSFIGAAIVKHFERVEHARPLIVCPKPLEEMWERYNEAYHLNARVLPMSQLQSDRDRGVNLEDDPRYKDRNFILIDESHHFRHHTSQRYEVLQSYTAKEWRKVCLLTATPRNSRARDVYNQIKLFHPDDRTDLPIEPQDLRRYFKHVEDGERRLQDALVHLMVRRRRRDILRWYGFTGDTHTEMRKLSDEDAAAYLNGSKRAYVMVAGRHQYFPLRELETLTYSIDATYSGGRSRAGGSLYQRLRRYLGRPTGEKYSPKPGEELTYARYGLWNYVQPGKKKSAPYQDLRRAGMNLRGILRTGLFKRFESSVEAFRKSLERMMRTQGMFLDALEKGLMPAGEDAEKLLGKAGLVGEDDLLDALSEVSKTYRLADFNADLLKEHVRADLDLLEEMHDLVKPITPDKDAKLQTLISRLGKAPLRNNKVLIFSQFADTALYLHENLNPGGRRKDIEIIYGTEKSKSRVAGRFAPKANPELAPSRPEEEIRILVATDVMSEGLNLQDCSNVINYDLHWNPVRLIQRFGRIDRIGSEHDRVRAFNFLPETELERQIQLRAILTARIREIQETIGEDAAILDPGERINTEAMYAIYEGRADKLPDEEGVERGQFVDLNEAEEFFRALERENPAEYERIKQLRDGIRSSKIGAEEGTFVFCQAGRYSQLFLTDKAGEIVTRDLPRVLGAIRATSDSPMAAEIPDGHNRAVTRVKDAFVEEVKHRRTLREYGLSLTQGQKYVLRELRAEFALTAEDDEVRGRINELERCFKGPLTAAVKRELNRVRQNALTGQVLLRALTDIYLHHRLADTPDVAQRLEQEEIPRIICSENLQG